jgi:hypothetical protein
LQEGLGALVVRDFDRHAARLPPDIGRECEQLPALDGKRRRLLLLGAADIDPLLEIDRTSAGGVEEISVLISMISPRLAFAGALMSARAMVKLPRDTRRA